MFYRWQKLLTDSDDRKQRLLRLQEQYRQVEDLYLTFAKRASGFNSWFENAEEDLTDPVRCNSVEEILVSNKYRLYIDFVQSSLIYYIPRRKSGIYWIQVRRAAAAAAAVEISLWTR